MMMMMMMMMQSQYYRRDSTRDAHVTCRIDLRRVSHFFLWESHSTVHQFSCKVRNAQTVRILREFYFALFDAGISWLISGWRYKTQACGLNVAEKNLAGDFSENLVEKKVRNALLDIITYAYRLTDDVWRQKKRRTVAWSNPTATTSCRIDSESDWLACSQDDGPETRRPASQPARLPTDNWFDQYIFKELIIKWQCLLTALSVK